MGIIHAPGLWSFVYSTNFQIKQIPASNIFLGNINTFSIKPKKIINLFSLRSRYRRLANRKKLILPLGNYIKTLKEHNFLINVQFNSVRNDGVSTSYRRLIGVETTSCVYWASSFISCFTSVLISIDTFFYNILELHSKLSEKDFRRDFPF